MLEVEKRKYVIRGLTPILGSMPASPAIRTMYISSCCTLRLRTLVSDCSTHVAQLSQGLADALVIHRFCLGALAAGKAGIRHHLTVLSPQGNQ